MGMLPELGHIDAALTGFALDYAKSQGEFIGPLVAPVLNVGKKSDKYWVGDKTAFEVPNLARGPGGDYPMISWTKSTESYDCEGFGDSFPLTAEEIANADPMIDPAQDGTAAIVSQMMIAAERRIAAAAFDAAVFTQTSGLTSTARWDSSAPDPWANRRTANAAVRPSTGHKVNTLVINDDEWEYLRAMDEIKNAVFGSTNPQGVPTTAQVASVLGIKQIIVGTGTYWNGSTFVDIWGKSALWAYYPDSVSENAGRVIVPMRTMVWSVGGKGRYAVDGPHPERGKNSFMYYVDDYTDEKVTCSAAGYLFTTVIS